MSNLKVFYQFGLIIVNKKIFYRQLAGLESSPSKCLLGVVVSYFLFTFDSFYFTIPPCVLICTNFKF